MQIIDSVKLENRDWNCNLPSLVVYCERKRGNVAKPPEYLYTLCRDSQSYRQQLSLVLTVAGVKVSRGSSESVSQAVTSCNIVSVNSYFPHPLCCRISLKYFSHRNIFHREIFVCMSVQLSEGVSPLCIF